VLSSWRQVRRDAGRELPDPTVDAGVAEAGEGQKQNDSDGRPFCVLNAALCAG
jgi:hypothetical protein